MSLTDEQKKAAREAGDKYPLAYDYYFSEQAWLAAWEAALRSRDAEVAALKQALIEAADIADDAGKDTAKWRELAK